MPGKSKLIIFHFNDLWLEMKSNFGYFFFFTSHTTTPHVFHWTPLSQFSCLNKCRICAIDSQMYVSPALHSLFIPIIHNLLYRIWSQHYLSFLILILDLCSDASFKAWHLYDYVLVIILNILIACTFFGKRVQISH